MMMALTNHLIAYPFPTLAALIANAATISAWANSAYCSGWYHPQPLRRRPLCTSSMSSLAISRSKATHLRNDFNKKRYYWKDREGKVWLNSIISESIASGGIEEYDILSAVRRSLRYDLVQPHRDEMTTLGLDIENSTLVLVLAVSGGCDSMALFHSLVSSTTICEKQSDDGGVGTGNVCYGKSRRLLHLGIENAQLEPQSCIVPCELHVAHFNHEQRGESSDGDCDFVRDRCIEHEVPFYSYSWSDEEVPAVDINDSTRYHRGSDPKEALYDNTIFTQDAARQWRQRKLKELLSSLILASDDSSDTDSRWGAIVTAHHRDDADETIMLKLLRGSHLTNLRSMNARSERFCLQSGNHTSSIGYFAKPMLKVRKSHVIQYLRMNSLGWREDASNSSNKYKRNMVRNELMPLLSEIAGGESALRKRLDNLEKQSREISQYLSEQSHDYLRSMSSDTKFILRRDSGNVQFDIVHEQALHVWITKTTLGRMQVSYDQMLLIRDQIQNYPNNLQWKMDLGRHWEIQRNGDTLVVVKGKERVQTTNSRTLPGILFAGPASDMNGFNSKDIPDVQETVELCFGSLPNNVGNSTIDIVHVKDCAGMKFTPSWRQGRSAMKLKDFLRGQHVPLHRRDDSIALCLSDNNSLRHVLAVHVEDSAEGGAGKWIVSANFSPQDDLPVTKVVLGKSTKHSTHTPHRP